MDFSEYKDFLDELFRRLSALGIDVSDLEMDHVAVKTSTIEEYYKLKPEFDKFSKLVHENVVRGRNVDVYKLNNFWKYKNYLIPAIELIGPKEGDILNTGFEHAEFVLKNGFQEFLKRYPNFGWDTSIMNAPEFPMIKLKLGEDMQVKFHLEPILEIIGEEEKTLDIEAGK